MDCCLAVCSAFIVVENRRGLKLEDAGERGVGFRAAVWVLEFFGVYGVGSRVRAFDCYVEICYLQL